VNILSNSAHLGISSAGARGSVTCSQGFPLHLLQLQSDDPSLWRPRQRPGLEKAHWR